VYEARIKIRAENSTIVSAKLTNNMVHLSDLLSVYTKNNS